MTYFQVICTFTLLSKLVLLTLYEESSTTTFMLQCSTLEKTFGPAGSQVFRFGRQKFLALWAENFHLKFPHYKLYTPPSLQREGKVKMKNHT